MNYAAVYFLYLITPISPLSEHPKLIIISFDGFRYDLLDSRLVPNLAEWTSSGAHFINGIAPQFPVFTAVNHMAISTGLYTESHGVVSNVFFDRSRGRIFDYWNDTKTPGIYEATVDGTFFRHTGEPIWITNERSGFRRRSACINWPFCEVPYPMVPSRASTYRVDWIDDRPLRERNKDVDEIVELFTNTYSPVNFVAWYIGEPDRVLHTHGFYDGYYEERMRELDILFGYFLEKMKSSGLSDKVNIIFTADHGHTQVNGVDSVLCIEDHVDMKRIHWGFNMIYAEDKKHADEIYASLTRAISDNGYKIKLFKKENFDNRFHYTEGAHSSQRIGDIILQAEPGYEVKFDCSAVKEAKNQHKPLHMSIHGLDPNEPESRAVLVLHGPSVKKGQKIDRIPQNIDLYPLMCYFLEIEPAPNNGTMLTFETNVEFTDIHRSFYHGFTIIVVPLVGMVILLIVVAATQCCKGACTSRRAESEQSDRSIVSRRNVEKSSGEKEHGRSPDVDKNL
ncbi:unnamed protein product [Cylicocyclus nassatus]|uniref:AP3A hydrolase n=1 Tax=Cylicocyclus nassatus TaxID=53992 RepID=A0AA36H222_CYLNA|nr:unnamed protein product [Cylicocyclus nassatus]